MISIQKYYMVLQCPIEKIRNQKKRDHHQHQVHLVIIQLK